MDIKDIIEIIPKLFIYFIPGYIAITIKKRFKNQKDYKDTHNIIMSIVISFIITTMVDAIINFVEWKFTIQLSITETIKNMLLILFSFIIGVLWILYYDSKFEKFINELLNCNIISQSNVWNKAMKASKGAWARVYLHEYNILYEGQLKYYTIDPEDDNKEILLTSYTSYKIDTKEIIEEYDDEEKTVLINCKNWINIEILKD